MPVTEFKSIRKRIYAELLDTAKLRWTNDELDIYINEAQREYALRSHALTGAIHISFDGACACYGLPDDFIAVKKFINDSGVELPCKSWVAIRELLGDTFLSDTAKEASFICNDFYDWNRISFHPIPEDGLTGNLYYARTPVSDKLEVDNEDVIFYYSIAQCYLKEGGKLLSKFDYYYKLFEKHFTNRTEDRPKIKKSTVWF